MIFKENLIIKLLLLFIAITSYAEAQQNYTITYEFIDKDGVSLESKLITNQKESVFKILDDRKYGKTLSEDGDSSYYVVNDELSTFIYSNNDFSYIRIPYPELRKGTAYKSKKEPLDWKLTGNTKKINQYNCQEALVELKGRHYTVWFTPDIPIAYGPLKLDGLPGLIVQVKEELDYCSINLISIKNKINHSLFENSKAYFNKEQVMTFVDYEKFIKKFVVGNKIDKAQKIAQMKNLYNMDEGDLSIDLKNGEHHFVRMLIDIPEGIIKELEKISLY